MPNNELIQLPSSTVNDLGKVQLLKFESYGLKLSLQLERNGNAGDVHDKTIPKLNAPIVARSKQKRFSEKRTKINPKI